MKNEIIFLIEESIDGGYEAKALGESIYTQAETYEQIKENIKEAVLCHFDDEEKPLFIRYHFVKDEVTAV
ncbi:MAG TPA: 2-oxoisovalerate dehydrogenase [Clostridiales bacterium]|nr:MAG: 2-oxoisovalerate dehydrogenase [Clostridiales bacterium GWD2_32_59]HAN09063.1 2-oxoisovalerate dehydrogenase [Clostridiales bacterium]